LSAEVATSSEARSIPFELLRLTLTEPPAEAADIRSGHYFCFVDSLPEVVEKRFIVPPLDEVVENAEVTEVQLHLKSVVPPQESLARVTLQRRTVSPYAIALTEVQYDVLALPEKVGPYLYAVSTLDIFPQENSPTQLGASAEGVQGMDLDWAASELLPAQAQLYIAFHVARDRQRNPMSHDGLDDIQRAKLHPCLASSAEAQFLTDLIRRAPTL